MMRTFGSRCLPPVEHHPIQMQKRNFFRTSSQQVLRLPLRNRTWSILSASRFPCLRSTTPILRMSSTRTMAFYFLIMKSGSLLPIPRKLVGSPVLPLFASMIPT
ncbi:hypothetical protein [Lucky bamboo bacilliform virus]|nr:hypothetical protein [Lucky bamboo bacilliform virus]